MIKLLIASDRILFPLGQVVITAAAQARLDPMAVLEGLRRHAACDWGEIDPDDAQLNDDALEDGSRLLSVYGRDEGRYWIITEADRSVTTILLPEDY